MRKHANLFKQVTVIELTQPDQAMATFQLIRVEGDFLDQLGFIRERPITICQEGYKLVILREAVDQKTTSAGKPETYVKSGEDSNP